MMKSPLCRGRLNYFAWPLLIMLVAAALRFHDLALSPPGLTHDEADHGLTAWQIATEGLRGIYFTVGYGREPLYDYVVALFMSFLGPTILAARLVSVFAGLVLIAAMIAWVMRAFNRSTALLTGAGLAVGFWPLMSARQALRSIMLPALFVLALLLFWLALENLSRDGEQRGGPLWHGARGLLPFIASGALLGLTFYTYIPARALWVVFPLLLLYWLVRDRALWRLMWWRTAVLLLVMFLIASPLLAYLQLNPEAEVRIQQLAAPLLQARTGDWQGLSGSFWGSLRLFFLEGDPAWRYNLDKRPFLNPLFGILFLAGVAQTGWWAVARRDGRASLLGSASFIALTWLVVGLVPVLITGPALSMTQAIAVQPLVFLFPAVALVAAGAWLSRHMPALPTWSYKVGVILLYGVLALTTGRDYFLVWTNHPEVRVQYESTMIAAIDFLNRAGAGEALVSTITPGQFHTPALAAMTLANEDVEPRWFDGRGAMLLPHEALATLIVPGFTPLPPALVDFTAGVTLAETLALPVSDRDRPLQVYAVDRASMADAWDAELTPLTVRFGDAVMLQGYRIRPIEASPGSVINVITRWQVLQPLPDGVLFSHLLDQDGVPLAQADLLSVPGESWSLGDQFLQLHQIHLPEDIAPGSYPIAVGVYTASDGHRLRPEIAAGGADLLPLATIEVQP